MLIDDVRVVRANARKIVQEAAKIKNVDMRRDIGLAALVIVNFCNAAIKASGEPDPLLQYFLLPGLRVPWDEVPWGEAKPECPASVVLPFPDRMNSNWCKCTSWAV
jgi:hypothetical protein